MSFQIVFCTCPDVTTAEHLAQSLIAQKLAACVNIVPGITSIYYWQGEVQKTAEQLLLIKTSKELYSKLEAHIKQEHPYNIPEILAIDIAQGLPDYLAWLADFL